MHLRRDDGSWMFGLPRTGWVLGGQVLLLTLGFFGVIVSLVTGAAAHRHAVISAAVPEIVAAQAQDEALHPTITYSDIDWSAQAPPISRVVDDIATESLALTGVMLALLALIAVLVAARQAIWAHAVSAAAVISVACAGGPLALLVPPIHVTVPGNVFQGVPDPRATAAQNAAEIRVMHSYVGFGAPIWWRIVVAVVLAVLLIAATRLLRRTARADLHVAGSSTIGVGALLISGIAMLELDPPLLDGHGVGGLSWAVLVTAVLLSGAAATAGTALLDRRAGLLLPLLTFSIALAAWGEWTVHARPGGAPGVFGWVDFGGEAPSVGNIAGIAVLVTAPLLGWAVAFIARRAARWRSMSAVRPSSA